MQSIEWRPLSHKDGYEVSTDGEVRRKNKILAASPDRRGYLRVSLWTEKGCRKFSIHKLVAETFLGEREQGQVIRHLDGNNTNNKLSNIAYGSRAENEHDKVKHGTALCGSKHPKSKLTEDQVIEIRRLFDASESITALAKKYFVSYATVKNIVNRSRWRHLP